MAQVKDKSKGDKTFKPAATTAFYFAGGFRRNKGQNYFVHSKWDKITDDDINFNVIVGPLLHLCNETNKVKRIR